MGGSFGWMDAWSHVPPWAISWEEGGGCLRMSTGVLEKVCLCVFFSLLLCWCLKSGLGDDEKMWVIKERVGVGWFPFVLKRIFCTLGRKWYRLGNCMCVYIYIYIHTHRRRENYFWFNMASLAEGSLIKTHPVHDDKEPYETMMCTWEINSLFLWPTEGLCFLKLIYSLIF